MNYLIKTRRGSPVKNRPFTDYLNKFVRIKKIKKKKIMTRDMWHVTHDMWHVTRDRWHTWVGEHCLKISDPYLYRFGSYDVLKENDDLINEWMNESVTEVIVENPRLPRVS